MSDSAYVTCKSCENLSESGICSATGAVIDDPTLLFICPYHYPKVYDFCTRFRMADNIKSNTLNQNFNDPKLISIFDEKHNLTDNLDQAFDERIETKNNFLAMLYGPKGTGKSMVALKLMTIWLSKFFDIPKRDIYTRLGFFDSDEDCLGFTGFSDSEMTQIYPKMINVEGKFGVRDESPEDSGTHIRAMQKQLTNMNNITRAHQVSFLFLCPQRIDVDGVDYYFEMAGIDRETRMSRVILYDPEYKNGKVPKGRFFVKVPSEDLKYVKEYEIRKKWNIKSTIAHSGISGVLVDPAKWEGDKQKLFDYCWEQEIGTKDLMVPALMDFNAQFDPAKDKDKMIMVLDGTYKKALIDYVWAAMKKEKKRVAEERKRKLAEERAKRRKKEKEKKKELWNELKKSLIKFEPDREQYELPHLFDIIREEKTRWQNTERDLKIYLMVKKENRLYREIMAMYNTLNDASSISKVIEKVQGEINRLRGEIHERDYLAYLESLNLFDDVKRYGDTGMPDIVAQKGDTSYVLSLKCYDLSNYDGSYVLSVEDFYIEVEYTNRIKYVKGKDAECFLIAMNLDDFRTQLHIINTTRPKNITLHEELPYKQESLSATS